MELPAKANAILTAVGLLVGAIGTGGAISAKSDATDNAENLKTWTLSIQKQLTALELRTAIDIARMQGYREGFDAGKKAAVGP